MEQKPGGGRHRTATTHVDNTVEGLWLAATRETIHDGAPLTE